MSVNRHLRGDRHEFLAAVRGKTIVEAGDLMYLNPTDSYYAMPFSECFDPTTVTSKETTLYANFAGVAMEASLSGTSENISIATAGVFRFPITGYPSAVTVGAVVSAASSPAGSAASAQVVTNHSTAAGLGTTAYLGYIVKTESATTYVDFRLRAESGPGGLIPQ